MRRKTSLIFCIFILTVAGCLSQSGQVKTEGTVGGAAIGAGIGALLGQVVGGDTGGTLVGAGIGAAVGGLAGNIYASIIKKQNKQLTEKDDDLDAQIKHARSIYKDTDSYNTELKMALSEFEHNVTNLVKQINGGEASASQLLDEKHRIQSDLEEAKRNLELAERQLVSLREFQSKSGSSELDTEIVRLEEIIIKVKQNTKKLANVSQRI